MTGVHAHVSRLLDHWEPLATLRSSAAFALAGKSLEMLTLVALIVLLPRSLGSADFGAFALALSIVFLSASSVALGGPTLASRFLAAAPAHERTALARGIAVRSATWRLGGVAAAGLVTAFLIAVRPGLVSGTAAALVFVAIVFDVVATLVLQVGLALGAVAAWTFRYPLQNTVLVAAALVLHSSLGRTGALLAIPLASAASLLLALTSTLPRLRGVRTAQLLPHGLTRFAVVQSASGLFVQALHRGGVIAVALLGGSDGEVGFAALAAGIATAATYVFWQVYTLELPRIAGQAPERAHRTTTHLTRVCLGVAAPAALVGVLLCPTAIPALVGREYQNAVTAIALALAIVPLAPGMAAINQVAALRIRPESRLAAVSLGFVAFAILAPPLAWQYGATGASGALVIGSALVVAAGGLHSRRTLDRSLAVASLVAAGTVGGIALLV